MKTFSKCQSIINVIMIVFCIVLFSAQMQAVEGKPENTTNKELVNKLLQLTYNCQFKEAKELVHQVLKKDSLSIEWNYFNGMIIYRSMFQKEEYREEGSQFTSIMKQVIKMGEDQLVRDPQDTIALFYTGGAYGYLARYINREGSLFKAASVANKGMKLHEKLIAVSPQCYDAYLSLGIYHSVASGLPWILKPVLFIFGISGNEEKGIEYLSMVSLKGSLGVYEARWVLYDLLLRRKDYEQAAKNIQSLATQFPNNYLYAIRAVELLRYLGHSSDVIDIGGRIWEIRKTSNNIVIANDSMFTDHICYYYVKHILDKVNPRKQLKYSKS